MSRVSIIIPAYRAESFIARAVQSVLAQSFQDFEIVIASDDAQDYQYILAAQGIADSRLIFTSTNGVRTGVSHARNTALNAASSDIIALLDADDAFYPTRLARMMPLAEQYGCCVSAFDYKEGERLIRRLGMVPEAPLTAERFLHVHYSINSMHVFDRRRVCTRWREDLPLMEDIVFSMSIFNDLPAIYHVAEPLYIYHYTPHSMSTSSDSPERFMAAKQSILRMLDENTLHVDNPQAKKALRDFTRISLEVEAEYAVAMQRGERVTFTELLEARL
jgi:glycosyltransferase involved in cell wall biosynthesis